MVLHPPDAADVIRKAGEAERTHISNVIYDFKGQIASCKERARRAEDALEEERRARDCVEAWQKLASRRYRKLKEKCRKRGISVSSDSSLSQSPRKGFNKKRIRMGESQE